MFVVAAKWEGYLGWSKLSFEVGQAMFEVG